MIYEDQFKNFGFVPFNHDVPKYFEVLTEPVIGAKTGLPAACSKRVYRGDTNDTLSVMSDSYRVIQDTDVFGAFEYALNTSGLNIAGLQVNRDRSPSGSKMFCQYVLPEVTENINGTPVSLRFLAWNSHDGSAAMNVRAGFFTWVCANMSVMGKELGSFRVTHRGEQSDIHVEIKTLVEGATNANALLQQMKRWTQIPVLSGTAIEVFKALPGSSDSLVADLNLEWTKAQGKTNHPNGGATAWALHNVLTGWATHGSGRTKDVASQRIERQVRVAKLEEGKVWQALVA